MAAPQFVPTAPSTRRVVRVTRQRSDGWIADRPGELTGRQPGDRLGYQGPDQGYALTIAERVAARMTAPAGESPADAIRGCLGVALRRASMFGRAPVIHDLNIASTIWGFFDPSPPAELVELRRRMFEGVERDPPLRRGSDDRRLVPEATLRMAPEQVTAHIRPAGANSSGLRPVG